MSSNYSDLERAYEEAGSLEDGPPDDFVYPGDDDYGDCSCDTCDDHFDFATSWDNDNPPDDFDDAESSEPQMWFDKAMQTVLGSALETATQRGVEYADSWALVSQHTPHIDMVINHLIDLDARFLQRKYAKRILMLASLCDVKLSRLGGGFKEDTLVDLVNYQAALLYAINSIEADKASS